MTRRSFLKATGGAALTGVAAGTLLAGPRKAYAAAMPKKWDSEVDVAVIGSGFAGLAAAIEAKEAGASVVVYEKMRVPGGNSIINGGVMAVAGSDMQEAKGIKDTPDLMLEDMMKAGLYLNYYRMVFQSMNLEPLLWLGILTGLVALALMFAAALRLLFQPPMRLQ